VLYNKSWCPKFRVLCRKFRRYNTSADPPAIAKRPRWLLAGETSLAVEALEETVPIHRNVLAVVSVVTIWPVASLGAQQGAEASDATRISRGKYLVEGVGVCWRCHTPRDATGEPDRNR
jgi:hypothetical protein